MKIARTTLAAVCLSATALLASVSAPAWSGPTSPDPGPPSGDYLNVQDFGAKGDGVTDDYDALQKVAATVNAAGHGTVYFPPGVYRIDRYKIVNGPNANKVMNIKWEKCNGLRIVGYGAKIDVKGDFRRDKDVPVDDNNDGIPDEAISFSDQVVPFQFDDCTNFSLEGLEIDGNVDQMSRDPLVKYAEGGNSAVVTVNCSNYTLKDLTVHHFEADGIMLGSPFYDPAYYWSARTGKPDRNATLENVSSRFNSRQGVAIMQMVGGNFVDCTFTDTGVTGGTYGPSEPAAGVDIEPTYFDHAYYKAWSPQLSVQPGDIIVPTQPNGHFYRVRTAGTTGATEPAWPTTDWDTVNDGSVVWAESGPTADEITSGLTFRNCALWNNYGAQFQCNEVLPNMKLDGCTIMDGDSASATSVYFVVGSGSIENCWMRVRHVLLGYSNMMGTSYVTVRNNYIASDGAGLLALVYKAGKAFTTIENNMFVGTHKGPIVGTDGVPGDGRFIYLQNPSAIFRNNKVFVPKDVLGNATTRIAIEMGVGTSQNNTFYTNLPANGTSPYGLAVNFMDAGSSQGDQFVSGAIWPLGLKSSATTGAAPTLPTRLRMGVRQPATLMPVR